MDMTLQPTSALLDLITIVIIVLATWLVSKGLIRALTVAIEKSGSKSISINRLRDAITLVAIIVTVALVFDFTQVGGDLTGLTLTGVMAIIISLALQETLSNIISGLVLIYDGYVREGDVIEINFVRGTLVRLTLRNSYIQTKDKNFVAVCNQKMLQGPLINFSRNGELFTKVAGGITE
jgi:small conductance mechanosensitive channel